MPFGFSGGIHPEESKDMTRGKPIETISAPEKVVLPVIMHIGEACAPIVKEGDTVDMGQMVAYSDAEISAPVHSPVSGKVQKIEDALYPSGSKVLSITIKNDFEDRLHSSIVRKKYSAMSQEEIIEHIRNAGIVGHGGATFPTHVKIRSALNKVDTVIINAAECEPYLTCDHRLLLERPGEVLRGIRILLKALNLKKAVIAVEANKEDAVKVLKEKIGEKKDIEICVLNTRFPQGAEKQLIYALTKREVPKGKLPVDAACVVFNVDTAAAVCRAFEIGIPDIIKTITVSGSAIANPKNLMVRIGTPVSDLIEAAGGFKQEPNRIIMGGPMMGVGQSSLDVPVIKATNGILAFCEKEDKISKNPTCIRCGRCVSVCPMGLMPIYMYMYQQKGMLDECRDMDVESCIECGCCAYECPGRLFLVQSFRTAKQLISEARLREAQRQN